MLRSTQKTDMREYILTDREREAVKRFLQDKKPNDYIHLIRHRAKQCLPALRKDLELLERLV